jgi:glutamate N-acetyltransferase/amino-acid N-acetyltransferase
MSVTAPRGFIAGGGVAGIKETSGLDLAVVIATDGAATAAGIFTQNAAAAAPVLVTRRHLGGGRTRAVLLNSGCANAGTGREGMSDAMSSAASLGALLGCSTEEVAVCSTGPIGSRLPPGAIERALPGLVRGASVEGGEQAALAILTTDSRPKTVVVEADGYKVGGMAKGAGMLRPNLATMLAVLTTDAATQAEVLHAALAEAAAPTFNSLNVDGCESTNDTLLVLASGRSGVRPSADALGHRLELACRSLAEQMAADAEGASKVVTLRVLGASDSAEARSIGRGVADSALVRASFYGGDPNWGRILAALGTQGVDPTEVEIVYEDTLVAAAGAAVPFDTGSLAARLKAAFTVTIRVGTGPGEALVTTTDLTPDYVRFNGEPS